MYCTCKALFVCPCWRFRTRSTNKDHAKYLFTTSLTFTSLLPKTFFSFSFFSPPLYLYSLSFKHRKHGGFNAQSDEDTLHPLSLNSVRFPPVSLPPADTGQSSNSLISLPSSLHPSSLHSHNLIPLLLFPSSLDPCPPSFCSLTFLLYPRPSSHLGSPSSTVWNKHPH